MDVITIPMTQAQYDKASAVLQASPKVGCLISGNRGSVTSQQLDFDFAFDGALLTLSSLVRHGFAKFASDDTIKSHIEGMLA